MLSLVGWLYISKWAGKKMAAYMGGLILIPCMVGYGLMPAHQTIFVGVLSVIGGIGVGNMLLMPWAMLPDVMEIDELKCGYRREGIFYSWFVFFQKIGLGISLGLSSLLMGMVGYIPPSSQTSSETPQPDSVILALRLVVSLVPGVLLVISMISVWLFPITRATHADTLQKVLNQRNETPPSPQPPSEISQDHGEEEDHSAEL